YVALRGKAKELMSPSAPSLPIFWSHGHDDPCLKIGFSLSIAEALASDLDVPFTAYSGKLSGLDTDVNILNRTSCNAESPKSISDSSGSMKAIQGDASLAEAIAANALRNPGLLFVTYEDLDHEMDEVMLQDLGVWFRVLLP
ncbi:hypothetical protein DXG01_009220, partial [Tephrocybe rancida]